MKSILTVCVGNICRSPMAEAILATALPDMAIASAGTGALTGQSADEVAQRLMVSRGLDISRHRGRQVTRLMCEAAELVLVMDSGQRRFLEQAYPSTCGKVFRICEFSKRDVPDPYRQGEASFKDALALIDDGVREWLHRIQKL